MRPSGSTWTGSRRSASRPRSTSPTPTTSSLVGPTGSGQIHRHRRDDLRPVRQCPAVERSKCSHVRARATATRGRVRLLFETAVNGMSSRGNCGARRSGCNVRNARLDRLRDPHGEDRQRSCIDRIRRGTPTPSRQLLGLTFDHFCQCVVLPQGAFSEFLRAKGSERREILLQLLGAGVYGTCSAQRTSAPLWQAVGLSAGRPARRPR